MKMTRTKLSISLAATALALLFAAPGPAQQSIELPTQSFREGQTVVFTTGTRLLTTSEVPVRIAFTFPGAIAPESAGSLQHPESNPGGGVDFFTTLYSGRFFCPDDESGGVAFEGLSPQALMALAPVLVPDPADGRVFYELTVTVTDWHWEAEYGLYSTVVSILPVQEQELISLSIEKYPQRYAHQSFAAPAGNKSTSSRISRRLHALRAAQSSSPRATSVATEATEEAASAAKARKPVKTARTKRPAK